MELGGRLPPVWSQRLSLEVPVKNSESMVACRRRLNGEIFRSGVILELVCISGMTAVPVQRDPQGACGKILVGEL